jgi:hypothetical protein
LKNLFIQFLLFAFFCLGDNPLLIYSTPVTLFLLVLTEKKHNQNILFYFLIFLFIFLYGIIIGIINNNQINYIINNSAGFFTLLFILTYNKYYNLLFNIKLIKIISLIIFIQIIASFLIVFFTNIEVYNSENYLITTLLGDFKGGSSTGHFRLFSVKSIISIYFFLVLYAYYLNKKKYLQSFIFLFFSFLLVILLASKGMITGYIFLLFVNFLFINKSYKILIFISFLFIIFLILFIQLDLFLLITATFDKDDIANANRLQQINYLFKSGFPFGRGFGALIESENFRSESSPYGFELSYYSYFHKFGVFILFFILFPLYVFIKNIIYKIKNKISFIDFSIVLFSFLYIMPSIGNPLLFHPYHTFLFIIPILIFNRGVGCNINNIHI